MNHTVQSVVAYGHHFQCVCQVCMWKSICQRLYTKKHICWKTWFLKKPLRHQEHILSMLFWFYLCRSNTRNFKPDIILWHGRPSTLQALCTRPCGGHTNTRGVLVWVNIGNLVLPNVAISVYKKGKKEFIRILPTPLTLIPCCVRRDDVEPHCRPKKRLDWCKGKKVWNKKSIRHLASLMRNMNI